MIPAGADRLALTVLAIAVCHARTVLDEAEARVGVRRCRFGIAPDRTDRSRTHLSPVSIEREQDERTA